MSQTSSQQAVLSLAVCLLLAGCRSFEPARSLDDPRIEQSQFVVLYRTDGASLVLEEVAVEGDRIKAVGLRKNPNGSSWERFDGTIAADSVAEIYVAQTDMQRTFFGTLMLLGYLGAAIGLYRCWPLRRWMK